MSPPRGVLVAAFDIRIAPTVDLVEFEKQIEKWCREAGHDVTYECVQVSCHD